MATFLHDGDEIDYTPPQDVGAGAVVVQHDLVAVAKRPIPASTLGALSVRGVFEFPKATGEGTAIDAGVELFWDEAVTVVTTDPAEGANKRVGHAIAAASDDDATVHVRLSQ